MRVDVRLETRSERRYIMQGFNMWKDESNCGGDAFRYFRDILIYFSVLVKYCVFFFFFQAEDGIRDIGVTGVQTCALPILRNPGISPFSLVAGVPFGGLHLATAFSLASKVPLIYLHPRKDGKGNVIEGNYLPGQTVLVIDDLITGGTSVVETARELRDAGLMVRDAIVLVDRRQRGKARLRANGINLHAMLELETLLN